MGNVAYYRVSTKKQGKSGLGLASQKAIVCHYHDCDSLVAEFEEIGSAKDIENRPILQDAIKLCTDGGHTLIVAKIDRLSRKTEDALAIYEQLQQRLISCDVANLDKFTLTIFMAIADRERELISIRTKAALQAAKERGTVLGKPENLTSQARVNGANTNKRQATKAYRTKSGYVTLLREQGLSFGAIGDKLNSEGHTTRNGKQFKAMTVKRMLDRVT